MKTNAQIITELTERIVILYANHSGRESEHRSEFRNDVHALLLKTLQDHDRELLGSVLRRAAILESPLTAINQIATELGIATDAV